MDNIINDVTPPIGIISSPHSGQTVSGNVNFTVEAQDENGISELEFSIDGVEVISVNNEASYTHVWDTTILENNSEHILSASVTDNFGNRTILQPVLVTVLNQ